MLEILERHSTDPIVKAAQEAEATEAARLKQENSEIAKTKRKKWTPAVIKNKALKMRIEHLRLRTDEKVHDAVRLGIHHLHLQLNNQEGLSEEKLQDTVDWLSSSKSNQISADLRQELMILEEELLSGATTCARKNTSKTSKNTTCLIQNSHGSMTWNFVSKGMKWIVNQAEQTIDFNIAEGAMTVYQQYSQHIRSEGKFLFFLLDTKTNNCIQRFFI